MTAEDEEFNRIEMESRIKKEYIRNMKPHVPFMSISMDDYLRLSDELAIARTLIRELGDRLAKLEKPWVGLTIEDVKVIEDNAPSKQMAIFMAEATLKEKNT
jgi:hypothetical protein